MDSFGRTLETAFDWTGSSAPCRPLMVPAAIICNRTCWRWFTDGRVSLSRHPSQAQCWTFPQCSAALSGGFLLQVDALKCSLGRFVFMDAPGGPRSSSSALHTLSMSPCTHHRPVTPRHSRSRVSFHFLRSIFIVMNFA